MKFFPGEIYHLYGSYGLFLWFNYRLFLENIKAIKQEIAIAIFYRVAISLKLKRSHTPKLVCLLVTCVDTCMNFLSQFQSIKFFDENGL